MKKIVKFIDPPSGWQYGFPKIIPDDVEDSEAWLVEQGYPQELITRYGNHFYCRYWTEEIEDETDKRSKQSL